MNTPKHVLWTGGWDSTFRVIQLYRLDSTIQPIYVDDHTRKSSKSELKVVKELTKKIPVRFSESKGNILPLIVIKRKNISSNIFLKTIHRKLKSKMNLGKQYYWLSCLAKTYKNLEVSLHKEDMDRFFNMDQLIEFDEGTLGTNWKTNPKKLDFYKKYLFSNMTFPLITISKPEMKTVAEEDDFLDLMETTWFCHKSNKKPCGKCNPCQQYIRDGFGYRLA